MSARPRPVTATFLPPAEHAGPSRGYSLSPGSSTASLVSVLDHDSCASLADDVDDSRKPESNNAREIISRSDKTDNGVNTRTMSASHKVDKRQPSGLSCNDRDQQQQRSRSLNEVHTKSKSAVGQRALSLDNRQLSAWEEWLLRKAVEERDRRETELRAKVVAERVVLEKETAKERKRMEARVKIEVWQEEYDTKLKQQKRLEMQRSKTQKQLHDEKKNEVQSKANANYQVWLEKVKQDELKRVHERKAQKEHDRQEHEMKQHKNEEAFRKWCEDAKSRPRTAPNSYGYSAGKLRGYYDASAYPAPSFVNPMPWRPIEIPQPKPPKKKSPKRRWNPEKYL